MKQDTGISFKAVVLVALLVIGGNLFLIYILVLLHLYLFLVFL